jgi:hypothetical protein
MADKNDQSRDNHQTQVRGPRDNQDPDTKKQRTRNQQNNNCFKPLIEF